MIERDEQYWEDAYRFRYHHAAAGRQQEETTGYEPDHTIAYGFAVIVVLGLAASGALLWAVVKGLSA